jgi:hypothetical protein
MKGVVSGDQASLIEQPFGTLCDEQETLVRRISHVERPDVSPQLSLFGRHILASIDPVTSTYFAIFKEGLMSMAD